MEKIKLFFYNHKTWVYNLQYILFSLILVLFVTLIDLRLLPIHDFIPEFLLMEVALSRNILTTLAGSLLTITTFTFSTILVILNTYASSYTPRVVENFLSMKITMKVLGIFIGGFFYCIIALLFVRDYFGHPTLLAGSVAIIYSIVCIIYFVRFVQAVISKFQGVNLIFDISKEAETVIAREVEQRISSSQYEIKEGYDAIKIKSNANGYLGVIDMEKILDILQEKKGRIHIECRIGEYIGHESVLATIYSQKDHFTQEECDQIMDGFILQDRKISVSNYQYNLTKIQEIALRALSPGINDPNTAVHCINKLGGLLTPLSRIDSYHIQQTQRKDAQIYYSSYSFQEDIRSLYLPIIEYGKTDLTVVQAILKSLEVMYPSATTKNQQEIDTILHHLEQKVLPLFTTDLEQEILRKDISRVNAKLLAQNS